MRLVRRGRAAGPLAMVGLWMLAAIACAQAPLRVRYPAAESAVDARQDYPRAVLARLELQILDDERVVLGGVPTDPLATLRFPLQRLQAAGKVVGTLQVVLDDADIRSRTVGRLRAVALATALVVAGHGEPRPCLPGAQADGTPGLAARLR